MFEVFSSFLLILRCVCFFFPSFGSRNLETMESKWMRTSCLFYAKSVKLHNVCCVSIHRLVHWKVLCAYLWSLDVIWWSLDMHKSRTFSEMEFLNGLEWSTSTSPSFMCAFVCTLGFSVISSSFSFTLLAELTKHFAPHTNHRRFQFIWIWCAREFERCKCSFEWPFCYCYCCWFHCFRKQN